MAAEAYCVLNNGTLTFYYDSSKSSRTGTKYTIAASYDYDSKPAWSNNNITKVVFNSSFASYYPLSTAYWFYFLNKLETITGISYLKTNNVTNMSSMFSGCSKLTSLDVSGFKTDNVTSMGAMFFGCSGLTSLDVSGFKTDNVTNMYGMFSGCYRLTSLDVSGFKTDNVTDMNAMFSNCSGLTSLDLSGFKTDNVTDMYGMFAYCSGLTSLDVSGFKTDNVKDMSHMFSECSGLTSLDLSGFKTGNVTDMGNMFEGCYRLTSLDVSGFKTDNVKYMSGMFCGCSGLTSLDVSGFKTDKVTHMGSMFSGCSGLTSLDVSGFKTDNVTSMGYMFFRCSGLTTLDVSGFKTDNVTNMGGMFYNCSSLTSLDVSGFKTDNVKDMSSMFSGCSSLTSLDVSGFKTDNVTRMERMFSGCSNLTTIKAGDGWITDNKVTASANMFLNCTNLVGGAGTKYDADHIDKAYAHIDGGASNPGYFTGDGSSEGDFVYNGGTIPYCVLNNGTLTFYYDSKPESRTGKKYNIATRYSAATERAWHDDASSVTKGAFDASFASYRPTSTNRWFYGCTKMTEITGMGNLNTENVTDMSAMFYNCSSLISLDVSNFETSKVTDMQFMFSGCEALTSLDVSRFNTSQVRNMSSMFQICRSLTKLDLSDFDTHNVQKMDWMFSRCENLTSLDVSSFDTSNVTDMQSMFRRCDLLPAIDVSGFITSNVTTMEYMFYSCKTLTSLNLKNFVVSKVASTEWMFNSCSSLKTIYANSSWNLSVNTNSTSMFYGCTSLVGGNGTKYSSSNVDKTYARPDVSGTPGYFTSKPDGDLATTTGTTAYAVFSGSTLTFYYDNLSSSRSGAKYAVKNTYSNSGSKPGWYENRAKITKAVFDESFAGYRPTSTACWFYQCSKLLSVEGMEHLNTQSVTSMEAMFRFCTVLGSIDLSHFDTSNVTNMAFMFCYCENLSNINVSTFNTAKVTDMQHMFHTCPVEVLDLSMFDTHNLVYTSTMFSDCSKLKTIYGSRALWTNAKMKASTSNYMFYRCNVLVGGMGTRFDSKHINYEYAIIDDGPTVNPGYLTDPLPAEKEAYAVYKDNVLTFYYDNLIRTRTGTIYRYNAGEFRTKSDDGWAKHFNDALVKTVVFDPSFGDFHELTTTSYWFGHKDNSILTEFKGMQYLNTENVTDMSNMFISCRALTAVDVSHFDTGNVTTMLGMFCYCSKIKKLDLTNFDTAKCLDMSFMFGECSSMTSVDVSSFDTGRVTTMEKMFYYCSTLPTLDITMFDTHSCKNMIGMFKSCNSLTVLDLSSFDTHNVEKMDDATYGGMFEYCNKVRTIYVGDGWSTAGLISHSDLLFKECNSLVGEAGTVYDPDHTDYIYAHVDGGPSNPGYLTYKSTSCDVNGDGVVDVADIATIIDVMAGKGDAALKNAADVNGDGTVDVADIATVITRMAELARR